VARQWGWASPSQFSAAYRRQFGLPPSQTLRS
jgi:AraC-like DNA-binding protein